MVNTLSFMRLAALLFFIVTSYFAGAWGRTHLPSPDETANAFFIRQFADTGSLRVREPLNVVAENLLHPRAVTIVEHDLTPGSFLGMILLYGWIAKILGLWVVPFLTPLFATIASFFFYKLVRLVFDERVARLCFFLFLLHPAIIYYTSRSLFTNMLFLSLLIVGVYYLVTALKATSYKLQATSSLFIGVALAVRTTEAGWVLGSLALVLFFHRRTVTWKHVAIIVAGIAIMFLPIFYYNTQLYGNPFYNGYAQIDSEAVPAAFAWHFQSRILTTLFALVLPFGVKLRVMLGNVYAYLVWLFWWLAVPTVLGIVLVARSITKSRNHEITKSSDQNSKIVFVFLCFYVFVTIWLVLYYGSWVLHDSTLTGATIGTSYTRYWLPIMVFGLPLLASALLAIPLRLRRAAFGLIALLSCTAVFASNGEGLLALRATAREQRSVTEAVLARTDARAIILTERSDKLFFPDRRVMFNDPLDQKKIDRVVARLFAEAPMYYFTEVAGRDMDYVNERRLAPYGVRWGAEEEIGGQRLYHLEKL